jgi:pimeloyl-ACP methyl ester carboxylesterase
MYTELLGKKIHYEFCGQGTPLLFVHGWGGNMHSMDALYKRFSKEFKCFRIDLPGFGKSENPEKNWGVEEYSEIVKQFIEKDIGLQVIYCGHSFGGSIGIYLAANAELFSKMILFAPAFNRKAEVKTSLSSKVPVYSKLKRILYPVRKLAYRIIYPNSQALKYPHLEENFKKIVSQNLIHLLGNISIETLILWGSKDTFVDVSDAYLLNGRIGKSKLKVYKDVEHNLPFVKVDEVFEDIKCFLDKK